MRLDKETAKVIREEVLKVVPDAKIYLFGSRVDSKSKGGDIDILVVSSKKPSLSGKLKIRAEILKRIGERKIDILFYKEGEKDAFFEFIFENAVEIGEGKLTEDNKIMNVRKKKLEELLKEGFKELEKSLQHLKVSYERCEGIDFDSLGEDELVELEALASRFSRTCDILTSKVFRTFLLYLREEPKTLIDTANFLEKLGVAKAEEILKLRDLRNLVFHEYKKEEEIREIWKDIISAVPLLEEVIENLKNFCRKYIDV